MGRKGETVELPELYGEGWPAQSSRLGVNRREAGSAGILPAMSASARTGLIAAFRNSSRAALGFAGRMPALPATGGNSQAVSTHQPTTRKVGVIYPRQLSS